MKTLFTLLLLLASVLDGVAQFNQNEQRQRNPRPWSQGRMSTVGAGLEIGVPVGAFSESWGREIVGFSANLGVPMRLLPIDWGFDFGYGRMGGSEQTVNINEPVLNVTTADLVVNSVIYGYHGLLRLKPFNGKVSPYLEGLVGVRHFTTKTFVEVEGLSEPLRKERVANRFTGSSGWAIGVHVSPIPIFYLEGRVERLSSGRVEYVDPTTISISNAGVVDFETRRSKTSVMNVHLGVGLRF